VGFSGGVSGIVSINVILDLSGFGNLKGLEITYLVRSVVESPYGTLISFRRFTAERSRDASRPMNETRMVIVRSAEAKL
jgi:hypothetical protein